MLNLLKFLTIVLNFDFSSAVNKDRRINRSSANDTLKRNVILNNDNINFELKSIVPSLSRRRRRKITLLKKKKTQTHTGKIVFTARSTQQYYREMKKKIIIIIKETKSITHRLYALIGIDLCVIKNILYAFLYDRF